MKNKNKKITLLSLGLGLGVAFSTLAIGTTLLSTNKIKANTKSSFNASVDETKDTGVIHNLQDLQNITLDNNSLISVFSPNSVISVPGGTILPTNKGIVFIDSKTKLIKWTCSNALIGTSTTNEVLNATYVPETSAPEKSAGSILITRKFDDRNVSLILIDIETGKIFSEIRLEQTISINENNPYIVSKVQGTTNKFIFTPAGIMRNLKRNENTYLITLGKNSFANAQKVNLFETEGTHETIVYSFGVISVNNIIWSVNFSYYYQGDISKSLVVVTKMNETSKEKAYAIIEGLNDQKFTASRFMSSFIKLSINKENPNIINFSSLNNISPQRNLIFAGSFDMSNYEFKVKNEISLSYNWNKNEKEEQNYKIQYGYYSENLNCWVTYCESTSLTKTKGSVVLFDLNNLNSNIDFSPKSSNVHIFTDLSQSSIFQSNSTDKWIPIIPYDKKIDNLDEILLFNTSNSLFKNKIIGSNLLLSLKSDSFSYSQFLIDNDRNVESIMNQINKEWIFKNKEILFLNPSLLTNANLITQLKTVKIDNESFNVLFSTQYKDYQFKVTKESTVLPPIYFDVKSVKAPIWKAISFISVGGIILISIISIAISRTINKK